jgi:ATP-dependent RNA helicase DDX41
LDLNVAVIMNEQSINLIATLFRFRFMSNKIYSETSWQYPSHLLTNDAQKIFFKLGIKSKSFIPPISSFKEMRFPEVVLKCLDEGEIVTPTTLQMGAIPIQMTGNNLCAISPSGSGKTLAFVLPIVMFAWEEELKLPYEKGDGPFGIILSLSEESCHQIIDVTKTICDTIGFKIRINMFDEEDSFSHLMINTFDNIPIKYLERCKFLVIDEADYILPNSITLIQFLVNRNDLYSQMQLSLFASQVNERVKEVMNEFHCNLISLDKIEQIDVIQHVDYVKQHDRLLFLEEAIQKTSPPVVIFANENDINDIVDHLNGVNFGRIAISVYSKNSLNLFKNNEYKVLVSTDNMLRGVDLNIKHVIHFELREISSYIWRIRKTGRNNKIGMSTVIVNRFTPDEQFFNLLNFLLEMNQRIPSFLRTLCENCLKKPKHF